MGIKQISLYLLSAFYLIAGLNHFIHPEFYFPLIPKYLVHIELINYISGIAEIVLGVGVLFTHTRKISALLIIMMLLVFALSHMYFITMGSCVAGSLCVPEWVAWIRLLIIHPLLIWWVWWIRE
ncbi:hypothetical protein J8281_05935 [Aquimarina sp. U1-2]|uniref:DoxX family protein n=1 Tax=Aquimarina sp. U1-2 TaxID=2823141 RepID=UPI001AECA7BA|nr:hypothetical protein [Aquimarina sp. U1-2]MBP2831724.1 hypothetical protein [Aquimarina sp. U1-2]